ncbi:hypothetical protein ACJ5NV_13590 [Loktanella agnita]|uniref:hypothetical protein n=1 Tax=Loktanella agnita TaxID=287097 RepID=UPI00398709CB
MNQLHFKEPSDRDFVPGLRYDRQSRERAIHIDDDLPALGPDPKASLEIFVDLGLSDDEIATYFGVQPRMISSLRKIWDIRF